MKHIAAWWDPVKAIGCAITTRYDDNGGRFIHTELFIYDKWQMTTDLQNFYVLTLF